MSHIYLQTVDTYRRSLVSMHKWLDKATAFAKAKKFDVDTLILARLAPDMFPFGKQVQVVCYCAKGHPELLCGREVLKLDDNEASFAELRERIEETLNYLAHFKPEDFKGCEDRRVPIPTGPNKWISGGEFVNQIANPEFFFHASMAYAILRNNGVDLGKIDFLGAVNVRQG